MAIDPRYIPAFSLETVFLDKDTGAPLSGGKLYFEDDEQPNDLRPIYQITGADPDYTFIQLPNPLILSSIGTCQDSLGNPIIPYFLPFASDNTIELYRIRVTSADDVPQYVREAQPYIPEDILPGEQVLTFTNELSNPQFSDILFTQSTGATITYTGTPSVVETPIAADWSLVVTGAGTVTVNQIRPTGTNNIPTNPGTMIQIQAVGVTQCLLRQRLQGSPALFGNQWISAGFVARIIGSQALLRLMYSQSSGLVVNQTLVSQTLTTNFQFYSQPFQLPSSNNAQAYPGAYVDIFFILPIGNLVQITSVMVTATGSISIPTLLYDEVPNARQTDQLFNYYKDPIFFKPVSSLLTAWDFPLNPAQLGETQTINATPKYIWDQLIARSSSGNVNVVRNTTTGGIQATTTADNQAFCYIQYLSGSAAQKILSTSLSVNIQGGRGQAGGAVTARVYLYRGSSASVIPSLTSGFLIGSLASTGVFTLNTTPGQGANWTPIPRGIYGDAIATLPTYLADLSPIDTQFSGWELDDNAQISDTHNFCMVVTFACPVTATPVIMQSISLTPGTIPTRPAPQSPADVMEECEYYYEKSKANGVPMTTPGGVNTLIIPQYASGTTDSDLYIRSFSLEYRVSKRATPVTTWYSELGVINQVTGYIFQGASGQIATAPINSSVWTTFDAGAKGISYVPNTSTRQVTIGIPFIANTTDAFLSLHYEADARLGIV